MSKISRQSTRDGPFGQVVFALLLVQKKGGTVRAHESSGRFNNVWNAVRVAGRVPLAFDFAGPIPGMPDGKPANTPCIQLDEQQRCKIFTSPLRPKVCAGLQASAEMCGNSRQQAMTWLINLEMLTAP